jgi:hypothetical protein
MSDAVSGQAIPTGELLARFITADGWIRADRTIKQDAFMPPKDLEFSVTRHLGLTQEEIWKLGQAVVDEIAKKRAATLHGRADLLAEITIQQNLRTVAHPLEGNANHAHVIGWPSDKPAQKIIAQQLAAAAVFVTPAPPALPAAEGPQPN